MMSDVTVLLLNWKRPDNLRQLLESLFCQTLRPTVFLWNNGETFIDDRIALSVQSSSNLRCWPRWWLAGHAETKYVCTVDDDLALRDDCVLEDLVNLMERQAQFAQIFGLEGVVIPPGGTYRSRQTPKGDSPLRPADIVKGRLMMLHQRAMQRVPMTVERTEDDIAVCGFLAQGRRRFHRQVTWLSGRVKELPQPHAICSEPGHFDRRDAAAKRFFGEPTRNESNEGVAR